MDLQTQALDWRSAPAGEFAVLGDPVAHSLSPLMQTAALRHLGLDHRYVAVRVPAGEVCEALDRLASLGYLGVNVTLPLKEEAIGWCLTVEPFVQRAKSVNCIDLVKREGINTDAPGFLETLRRGTGLQPVGAQGFVTPVETSVMSEARGYKPLGTHGLQTRATALLLGAGGSARALGVALLVAGWELKLWNRTRSKADELAELLRQAENGEILDSPDPSGCDLVVNATSASIKGEDLPVEWSRAPKGCVVYDLYYSSSPIPFLESAKKNGLAAVDGVPLLVAQGARSLEYWLNVKAPRQVMLDAVHDALSSHTA